MKSQKIKVAILHPILAPYRIPLFECLASDPAFEVKVFLDVESNPARPFWGSDRRISFESEVVRAAKVHLPWKIKRKGLGYSWDNFTLVPFRLPGRLSRFSPDVVISVEFGLRTLFTLIYARVRRKKVLVWSDEYLTGLAKYGSLRLGLRKSLIKMVDGFCSCGVENKKYLEFLGVPPGRIFRVGIATDNSFFSENSTEKSRNRIRKNLNLRGTVFFNIGQLWGRKGVDRLLKSWASLPEEILENSTLLFVGGGAEREKLIALSQRLKLSNMVFVPPQPWKDLPAYYAAGDVFIFPTLEDAWGLVVNEAMACGKPVLCSKYAGCCVELIKEGENGYGFDPLSEENTRKAIIKMYQNKERFAVMGARSRQIVSGYTYERMVSGFRKAIYYCMGVE